MLPSVTHFFGTCRSSRPGCGFWGNACRCNRVRRNHVIAFIFIFVVIVIIIYLYIFSLL